ncbi:MAG: LysM peptidoglycan-binding domain-containing protein [Bacteroidia bacterium]
MTTDYKKSKYIYIFLCTLCFVVYSSVTFAQEKGTVEIKKSTVTEKVNGTKYYMHTVEKGQTLYAIAKAYDLTLNDIVLENPAAIDGIQPGQVLKIPTKKHKKTVTEIPPDGADYILFKVDGGQTLYSIAKQHNTTVDKLKALNPELQDGLKSGQTIKIPATKEQVESSKTEKTKSKTAVAEMSAETTDSLHLHNYKGKIKTEYNIAFFLPFHATEANELDLEKLVKGDVQLPNKSTIALPFYEGALLAIDSLKKKNLKANIFVYDIDDTDSSNIINLIKKPELKEMDLMIGPLYGSSFMPIAKFAKEHSIAIVSPFTQINKILFDNLYVCKMLPSTAMQIELMANYAIDSFRTQNIILLNNGNPKEVTFYNAFKKAGNKALKKFTETAKDTIREVRSIAAVESLMNPNKTNVVILPSNNQSYVTDCISKLNKVNDKNKIVLFGLQSWLNFDNLDFEYLNKLSVHLPSNAYVDYTKQATKDFIAEYRYKFKTEPELYAFQGYDISLYFISLLQKYGTGFLNNIVDDKSEGIQADFNFMQYPLESGFENKFVYILKYHDYKLVKAN